MILTLGGRPSRSLQLAVRAFNEPVLVRDAGVLRGDGRIMKIADGREAERYHHAGDIGGLPTDFSRLGLQLSTSLNKGLPFGV